MSTIFVAWFLHGRLSTCVSIADDAKMAIPQKNNFKEGLCFLGFVIIGLNFLISGILINFVQLLFWVCLKPLNTWLYRKLTYYFTYAVWGRKFNFVHPVVESMTNVTIYHFLFQNQNFLLNGGQVQRALSIQMTKHGLRWEQNMQFFYLTILMKQTGCLVGLSVNMLEFQG